jgi:hypothetical protein
MLLPTHPDGHPNQTQFLGVPSISHVEVEPVSVPEARVSTAAESQPEIDLHAHPEPEAETGGATTESESGPTSPPRPPAPTDLVPPAESQEPDPRPDEATPTS